MRPLAAPLASLLTLAACHARVDLPSASTGTAAGTGGASIGTATGAGGSGGDPFDITVGVGVGVGGGGAFACNEPDAAYFLDISTSTTLQHLTSGCEQAMPWAHVFSAPGGEGGLAIDGCAAGTPIALRLRAGAEMTGTANVSLAKYTDENGASWTGSGGSLTISAYGAPGEAIDGTFAVTATSGADAGPPMSLSGSFHVCRRPDLLAP